MTQTLHAHPLQHQAASPHHCVWVAASAGTGKTKVLTDRVLNLLLHGSLPQRILCLTFTRAAAGEMSNRIQQRLSFWATADDLALQKDLQLLLGAAPTLEQTEHARKLFAKVLNTPTGVNVATLHSFCQSLLRRFPLEAGLTPHFQVMEGQTMADLLMQAERDVLHHAPTPELTQALATIAQVFDETSFREVLTTFLNYRQNLTWLKTKKSTEVQSLLADILEASLEKSTEKLCYEACLDENVPVTSLKYVISALIQGSEADQIRAKILQLWLESPPAQRQQKLSDYQDVFLTKEGTPRSPRFLLSKKVADAFPDAKQILLQEAERLESLLKKCRAFDVALTSWSILTIGLAILSQYQSLKKQRALLDYDDLIEMTLKLLCHSEAASWVLYKLDGGVDHILVDEAQDTSAPQWQIISALAHEFFSGRGARETLRTLFVVGDEKQSIYSFQGADPRVFDHMRLQFGQAAQAAQAAWKELSLTTSFRSTAAILETVDAVFAKEVARKGVTSSPQVIQHIAHRQGHGGCVEVWPLVAPPEEQSLTPWELPTSLETSKEASAAVRLAHVIASQIHTWLDTAEILPSRGRRILPSDILILFQRRCECGNELMKALKAKGVPVAGADRLLLLDHLAVQDLLALARFALLPYDDLTLAVVLKGPFIGMEEEHLFELAYDRPLHTPLWKILQIQTSSHARQAYTFLKDILIKAETLSPYDFFAYVLGAVGGQKALLTRLGSEAQDPLEEFLSLALTYQKMNIPSLQGFLKWLEAGQVEIKRDLEQGERQEVRIMTVHGAKGLQAPIVFLPDSVRVPRLQDRLLWHTLADGKGIPIWAAGRSWSYQAIEALKQAQHQQTLQEYRRLLYVALTRAEDQLYICGWKTHQKLNPESWYALITQTFENSSSLGQSHSYDFNKLHPQYGWQGDGWRVTCPQKIIPLNRALEKETLLSSLPSSVPSWGTKSPSKIEKTLKPLLPSHLQEEILPSKEVGSSAPLSSHQALQEGRLMHTLLQHLPQVPEHIRFTKAEDFLKHSDLTPKRKEHLIERALKILNIAEWQKFFGPRSFAEVPVAMVQQGRLLSGQIDRLYIEGKEIWIIDFKTDYALPPTPQAVPLSYRAQLESYRQSIKAIYPRHDIHTALLWVEGPVLMEI